MANVGRNEPCPCGSGKKFKKCHGSPTYQQMPAVARPAAGTSKTSPPLTFEINPVGVPGTRHHLVNFRKGADARQQAEDIGGSPGKYRVTFTLNRPGFPLTPERHYLASTFLKGDSHLAIAKPALMFLDGEDYDLLQFECTTPNGRLVFTGRPNDKGFMGKIESEEFDADSFSNAALKAHHALASILSNMSVYLDVPAHVYQMDVTEMRTGRVRLSIRTPFREVPGVAAPMEEVSEEQQKYASLYREALNGESSNYQFLCFYRIIEGLRARRARLRSQAAVDARARGERPRSYPEEKLPAEKSEQAAWLNSLYPLPQEWDDVAHDSVFIAEAVGRKVGNLIDKDGELHRLRNKIAHAVLDSGEPTISIDNGLDVDEVEKWLPLARCLARYLLKDNFPDMFRNS